MMAGLLWYRSYMDSLANTSGYYPDIHAGHADRVTELTLEAPYLVRETPAGYNQLKLSQIIGGTVAWNQLCNNGTSPVISASEVTFTVSNGTVTVNGTATANSVCYINGLNTTPFVSGHKYLMRGCPSGGSSQTYFQRLNVNGSFVAADTGDGVVYACSNTGNYIGVACFVVSGTSVSNKVFKPQLTDLTQMFGSTIADYVYTLEQSAAGSGIAWLQSYGFFTEDYIPYSAATLQSVEATSHVTVGKNLAPYPSTENGWENGYISGSGTIASQSATQLEMTSDYIPIGDAASVTLSFTLSSMPSNTNWCGFGFYADKSVASFVSREANTITAATSVTLSKAVPSGAKYFRVTLRTYGIVDTLQAEYGSTATEYSPYWSETNTFGSVTLRGITELVNGTLKYNGDTYEWDGTVTRYFGERAYQAGDESLTDAITDGTNTVYKLTTPTTESADPFTAVQTVEDGGTEEFTTSNNIPVGNVSVYRRA